MSLNQNKDHLICLPQAASTSLAVRFQATCTRDPEATALAWTYVSFLRVCECFFFSPCGKRYHLCTKCIRTAALPLTQAHTHTFLQCHFMTLNDCLSMCLLSSCTCSLVRFTCRSLPIFKNDFCFLIIEF